METQKDEKAIKSCDEKDENYVIIDDELKYIYQNTNSDETENNENTQIEDTEENKNYILNNNSVSDASIKDNVLDENLSVKLKNFYKKRTNYFNLNIEDLIQIENKILKLNIKKTIKFLLQDVEEKKFPLILIENFITIENENCIIFDKKKYYDNEEIVIDINNKKLFCNSELLNGNLKLFCNLINGMVYHPDVESIDNIENFDEFKNGIGLKDGILYSDNYVNVNSKVLNLEPNNLLIYFDNKEKTVKYFIRRVEKWWCNVEIDKLKDLNFLKVKTLEFK